MNAIHCKLRILLYQPNNKSRPTSFIVKTMDVTEAYQYKLKKHPRILTGRLHSVGISTLRQIMKRVEIYFLPDQHNPINLYLSYRHDMLPPLQGMVNVGIPTQSNKFKQQGGGRWQVRVLSKHLSELTTLVQDILTKLEKQHYELTVEGGPTRCSTSSEFGYREIVWLEYQHKEYTNNIRSSK